MALLGLLLTNVGEASVEYLKDIKPLFSARCTSCHGALKQNAKLRLDTVEFMLRGGKSGPALEPGKPESSLFFKRVTEANPDERMPPPHEGHPLTVAEAALLRQWITGGASAPADEKPEANPAEHWSFRPRTRPSVPKVARSAWVRNPIDAFLSEQHEATGLAPQPEASREILLRRLYLDLVGVPPTVDEITAFEADVATGWYERAVRRLLGDPRHGERWARHWMDIWRYSDWWGLGEELRNSQKHIWHWRDWIVESLNADTPYDQMVRQMLAADELYPKDLQKLRATGFLARNWILFSRLQWMDETVEHVSKGFLGLTMNCAKCHDHKYDPITQTDYYKMRAFFEPYHVRLDMLPNEPDFSRDGLPRVFDGLLDAPTYRYFRGDETKPDKTSLIAPGVPDVFSFKKLEIRPVLLPLEASQPERRPWVLEAYISAARRKVEAASNAHALLKQSVMREMESVTKASVSSPTPRGDDPNSRPSASPGEALQPSANTDQKASSSVGAGARLSTAPLELRVGELALALARAELRTVEHRSEAMRSAWAREDAGSDVSKADLAAVERRDASAAIRAHQEVMAAKARHHAADAELRLARAAPDKKGAIEKELAAARDALEKAMKNLVSEINETNRFTPLDGAKWTTTRFKHPNHDDPQIVFPASSSGRRSALADWITDARNPLPARVAINHIWMRHFGSPLAPNSFEFGRRNPAPAHAELIDWLATEFIESGWSMKHIHHLMVTSAAYRMSSSASGGEACQAKDPDNRLWWRRTPFRIESEVMRDSILALAGRLERGMGGPPVPAAEQGQSGRRSLYFVHSNNERNAFLTTFDAADVRECYRREQSVVPQQALAFSNSRLVLDAIGLIATRLGAGISDDDDAAFVRRAFLGVLGAPPTGDEIAACVAALRNLRALKDISPAQPRAHLIWVLLNHNDFVTLR